MQPVEPEWTCAVCGETHRGLPALAFEAPAHYYLIPWEQRSERALLTPDTCVVDGAAFYVRTVLHVPVQGQSATLEWGVWSSLSEANFQRYLNAFEDMDQSRLGPMPSWFASILPGYSSTLNLRSRILPQDNRQRPVVEFDPAQDHPLVADIRDGIALERATEFVEPILHRE
jgi:hypothetical protein